MRHIFEQPGIARAIQDEHRSARLVFALSPDLQSDIQHHAVGIDLLHVPYRGGAPALTDLISGQVQAMLDTIETKRAAAAQRA